MTACSIIVCFAALISVIYLAADILGLNSVHLTVTPPLPSPPFLQIIAINMPNFQGCSVAYTMMVREPLHGSPKNHYMKL